MKRSNISVSVVIPAFNEERSIADVIAQTETVLESLNLSHEVIVVDDGSSDKTRLFASNNGATLISYAGNRGKGYALRTGFAAAKGQVLVTLDADGSHRPHDIPMILETLMNGADVVFGSRYLEDNGNQVTTRIRTFGNRIFNMLIMFLTGMKVTDSQSGFRAYRREVLEEIELYSDGYDIDSELAVKTLKNGFNIKEAPIICLDRKAGNSKLRSFSDGFRIFKTILRSTFA